MRVELTAEVFTSDGFEMIIALMQQFVESRHEWAPSPLDVELADAYFREHAPKRAQTYALLAQKGMVSQSWSPSGPARPSALRITRESLADHVHDLSRPARVVVENQEGDGAFVLAVAYVFGAGKVVEAHEKRWLEFVQGGGSGEIPKVVRNEHSAFRRKARVSFLFDSDRLTPDEASKHEKAVAELSELGVSGHTLRFREAENYVPNRVLAAGAPARSRAGTAAKISHLKALVPEQRAHFDIKNGFWDKKRKRMAVLPEQEELYHSLPESVKLGLKEGFGEGLTLVLRREAEAGKLREEDFAALGPEVCDELQSLLALLREII